jgi:hypothetical protein
MEIDWWRHSNAQSSCLVNPFEKLDHNPGRHVRAKAQNIISFDLVIPAQHCCASPRKVGLRMRAGMPGKFDAVIGRRIGERSCNRHHLERLFFPDIFRPR